MTERELDLESRLNNALELLHRYQSSDTIRPASDAPTGDHTADKECMELLQRIDGLESRESDRAGKLIDIEAKIDKLMGMVSALEVVDPAGINRKLDLLSVAVAALPCHPNCPHHPPHLSEVPRAKVGAE